MIQGVLKKIVHSNFLTPGHEFFDWELQIWFPIPFFETAGQVCLSESLLKIISASKQPKMAPMQVRGNTNWDSHPSSSVPCVIDFFVFLIVIAFVFAWVMVLVF